MRGRRPYLHKRLANLCGRALHGYSMIQDGDHVLVGLSGGKDSLSLLWLLAERRHRIPIDYHLHAVHLEMGYQVTDHAALADFCASLQVDFQIIETDYGPRAHTNENREKSPCFFCALHRRRELFQLAGRNRWPKLALAHHQDDIFETFLMNLFFSGKLATMLPVQEFFGGEVTLIRPLSLISAVQTKKFAEKMGFPIQPPCCPSSQAGARARMRSLLNNLHHTNKKIRPNMWHALITHEMDNLPLQPKGARKSRTRKKP